jgi:hypothetical protein
MNSGLLKHSAPETFLWSVVKTGELIFRPWRSREYP